MSNNMDLHSRHNSADHDDIDASSISSTDDDYGDDDASHPTSLLDNSTNDLIKSSSKKDEHSDQEQRGKAFIEREEKHVQQVRCALVVIILMCAVLVSSSVYMLVHRSETRSFEREFEIFTSSVMATVQSKKSYNSALLKQLSSHITANALTSNATFPNITVPHFEIEAGYVNGIGGMTACAYSPFISDNARAQWEEYATAKKGWVNESITLRKTQIGHLFPLNGIKDDNNAYKAASIATNGDNELLLPVIQPEYTKQIYRWVNGSKQGLDEHSSNMYAPIWQVTPPISQAINSNLLSSQAFADLYSMMIATNGTVMSSPSAVDQIFDFAYDSSQANRKLEPHSYIAEPVYDSFASQKLVGMVVGLTPLDSLLGVSVGNEFNGILIVFTDNCGTNITFEINGPIVKFLGYSDLHDPMYDTYKKTASLELNKTVFEGTCSLDFHLYPSSTLENFYTTSKPMAYAFIVILSFVLTATLIVLYDRTVTKRQEKTMRSALRNGALVASLFPEIVRDRLLDDARPIVEGNKLIEEDAAQGSLFKTRPIADFFPNTTLMFADISGFTAWSSTREAFQVFELLETIYGAFDAIAKKRGVFKVETVGDCYVAVCGIPEAREDHGVVMAKFARSCLYKMRSLTKILEVKLGPDTSALAFRVGLHSGPVTGGVLRGDNARFQLFGDTVNTASRMESTGLPQKIQVSQATADLLIAASKEHWLKPRDEVVYAKGKGEMKTYWLTVEDDKNSSTGDSKPSTTPQLPLSIAKVDLTEGDATVCLDEKTVRLASWNSQVLLRFLKQIVARRQTCKDICQNEEWDDLVQPNVAVVDEIVEIITLPNFSTVSALESESANVSTEVEKQLHEYVESIAKLYRNNAFHNFDHASHVTMSVVKLLGRIVPTCVANTDKQSESEALALHDHTYGITSDPLTQFACVFAALIHDVDHHGVPNSQLVEEQNPIAERFDGNSVLEQNSVVLAWNLLMEPRFMALRTTLCANRTEAKRFRQLVVNAVMATDIMAADLKALRHCRWNKAFSKCPPKEEPSVTVNRKATIVIDHMIQASDVCHTMQHWHVYRKWNERLFMEMSKAYNEGRAENNPAETWYQGEIGFFDYYIIPLAKKLADCGVFGVSSAEYMAYAIKNRDEWEARGEEIVLEMVDRAKNNTDNKIN